ncbi:MAG TPA: hypothetical protein VE818_08315 [Nitrososphaeraceae archaeon]|nr:hypothetical protein [Nitrososphaeraceae archaeon]
MTFKEKRRYTLSFGGGRDTQTPLPQDSLLIIPNYLTRYLRRYQRIALTIASYIISREQRPIYQIIQEEYYQSIK